ncbi:MAG: hypothetical protein Q4A01_08420 [Coriobacteriales bacterium]|nr:hypothetical protein [Coriobacteriales bacterium]
MALDWNKEVSLGTILDLVRPNKGEAKGSTDYPTKTTMNLYQGDKQATDVRKVVLVGVLLFVAIVVFVKFGVFDQLALLSQKEGELAQQRALITAAQSAGTEDFGAMKEAYEAYLVQYGDGSVDVVSVLDMVDKYVKPRAEVTNIVLADGVLTLTLKDVPLDTVGDIARDVGKQKNLVTSVNVSTSSTQKTEGQSESVIVAKLVGGSSEEGK